MSDELILVIGVAAVVVILVALGRRSGGGPAPKLRPYIKESDLIAAEKSAAFEDGCCLTLY